MHFSWQNDSLQDNEAAPQATEAAAKPAKASKKAGAKAAGKAAAGTAAGKAAEKAAEQQRQAQLELLMMDDSALQDVARVGKQLSCYSLVANACYENV